MKNLFLLLASATILSCNNSTENSTEPVNDDTLAVKSEVYGEPITEDGAVTMDKFNEMMVGKDSLQVKVMATINECCKKKGCWMTVDRGNGEMMRVTFKDYGFFVPKNADGMTAIFDGWAYTDSISVEDQKHYLEDAGASEEEIATVTAGKPELTFVANGVIIKNEK